MVSLSQGLKLALVWHTDVQEFILESLFLFSMEIIKCTVNGLNPGVTCNSVV